MRIEVRKTSELKNWDKNPRGIKAKDYERLKTQIKDLHASKQDGLVLDLFGGSGTTLIACEQLDRTCYMMEIDPAYCDVIRKRYARFIDKEEEWQEITPRIQ